MFDFIILIFFYKNQIKFKFFIFIIQQFRLTIEDLTIFIFKITVIKKCSFKLL